MIKKWYVLSFLWQGAFFLLLAALVSFGYDKKSGLSALLGGLAYCIPTLLANLYVHHTDRAKNAMVVAYTGSVYRLMISAGLLVFLFKEMQLQPGVVVGSFCLGAVVHYVTSFVFINREK